MDTHDVSHIGQYMRFLAKQKAALNAALVHQGQHPKDMESQQELVSQFMMQYMLQDMRRLPLQNNPQMRCSFVAPPYPPSIAPLAKLKPIYIKDLKLETHHRGTYLLVRSLTPPNRMIAIMAVVEDENADAVTIQLYQQPDKKVRPATSVIMKDSVLLIKEPYFKLMGGGGYGVRVDHVSDLIHIQTGHDILPMRWNPRVLDIGKTANTWKQEGNEAMGKKHYWTAIQSYTAALECHPSAQERKTICLNRSLAYLKDGSFDASLTDTQCMESLSGVSEKALYRASQALYELNRFSECHDILALLCKGYPNNRDATTELERVRRRLAEQESGIYDFKSIYEEVMRTRPPHLDHATFIGPVVVKPSAGRGRGLFTTKAVKVGELLLCEKAFAHCYAEALEDSEANFDITLLMNTDTNRITIGTQGDLITTIVQKLWKNPSLLPQFTALHHGSYEAVSHAEVDNAPIIDTFLVARIISLNCFGCPLSSFDFYHKKPALSSKTGHDSSGIWLLASTINHSCLGNVRRSFIGDLLLVRAACDIPADTELTFWYRMPTGENSDMQKDLENWGFQCKCTICLDSKETPKKLLTKRNNLFGDLGAVMNASKVDLAKAERLLAVIDQTYKYPVATVPRLALQSHYIKLAALYSRQQKAAKSVSMALKALGLLGFEIYGAELPARSDKIFEVKKWGHMTEEVILAWIGIASTYFALAPHLHEQAKDCARLAYKICFGEDGTFGQMYDGLII